MGWAGLADLNNDLRGDLQDLAWLAEDWAKADMDIPYGWPGDWPSAGSPGSGTGRSGGGLFRLAGDVSWDGVVDLEDLAISTGNWLWEAER